MVSRPFSLEDAAALLWGAPLFPWMLRGHRLPRHHGGLALQRGHPHQPSAPRPSERAIRGGLSASTNVDPIEMNPQCINIYHLPKFFCLFFFSFLCWKKHSLRRTAGSFHVHWRPSLELPWNRLEGRVRVCWRSPGFGFR